MKKQIILVCQGGQQCAIVVEEAILQEVFKKIKHDIFNNSDKTFICISDYVPDKETINKMYIRTSTVNMVVITDLANSNNIQVPNKGLFMPQNIKKC